MADSAQPAREVTPEDKALAADWLKRIEAALNLRKDDEKQFERSRKWLRGIDPDNGKKIRTNLHFANLAAMRPQVYAKDPEYSVTVTKAVPDAQLKAWEGFAATAEEVVDHLLVRQAKLKRRAKRQLTSAYTCSVGWLKACWQEERGKDPQIINQLKDSQDNLALLERQRQDVGEAEHASDLELKRAQLQETIAGLEAKPEVVISKGVTLDFILPEDMLVLDRSVREVGDYERADAIAQRLWMTREQYKARFDYETSKAKSFREQAGAGIQPQSGSTDKALDLLAVWEVWEQTSGRVFTVCEGEEGFCRKTYSPDWTGERWYPHFLLAFNEVDGTWLPLSDVDLTVDLVKEYNRNRDDLVRDRQGTLPLNVVRKGGSLTPADMEKIANRQGSDVIVVEGVGGKPLTDDIFSGQLGRIDPANYDTAPARQDIEMISGGGDAARGSVLKAKTATEAEILAQGLRGRSAERTDVIEDLFSDMGKYVLEMALRKLSLEDVQKIAGADAQWPQLREDEVFQMVTLRVRGGSTGKPDRLQEQDRWTKLLPVIEKAMGQVSELRQAGQNDMAEAVIALVRETLRRFDERIEIERFLPAPKEGADPAAAQPPQIPPEIIQKVQEMQQTLQDTQAELDKAKQALLDKQGEIDASIRKAEAEAMAKVKIAEITAPIEADAKVLVAQVTAEQTARVQMHAKTLEAEGQQAELGQKATETDALAAIDQRFVEMNEGQMQLAQMLAQMGAPKPRMKVVHDTDPETGLITQSRAVPEEEAQEAQEPMGQEP